MGIEEYLPIAQALKRATDRPIWLKPNAGMPEMVEGQVVYRSTPTTFAARVPALLDAGVSFIGGCCGTTPAHIKQLTA